jgi:hypothetical protein
MPCVYTTLAFTLVSFCLRAGSLPSCLLSLLQADVHAVRSHCCSLIAMKKGGTLAIGPLKRNGGSEGVCSFACIACCS